MIDASCTLWEEDCGQKGSCWVYDNAWLSYRIVILIVIFKIFKLIATVLCLKLYKPQHVNTPNESTDKKLSYPDGQIAPGKETKNTEDDSMTAL